ncbi:MAG: hypothetical protein NZ518_08855 [Dehalococcoidia bacterium]|nr:hypothetical protein [Dehalococcoidia bacterium]
MTASPAFDRRARVIRVQSSLAYVAAAAEEYLASAHDDLPLTTRRMAREAKRLLLPLLSAQTPMYRQVAMLVDAVIIAIDESDRCSPPSKALMMRASNAALQAVTLLAAELTALNADRRHPGRGRFRRSIRLRQRLAPRVPVRRAQARRRAGWTLLAPPR